MAWWASIALMWTVTLVSAASGWYWRRRLAAATAELGGIIERGDRQVAEWCRNTHLTVITVTGTEITFSLEELRTSEHPSRSWNVPVSVALWSTLAAAPEPKDGAHA